MLIVVLVAVPSFVEGGGDSHRHYGGVVRSFGSCCCQGVVSCQGMLAALFLWRDAAAKFIIVAIVKNDVFCARASDLTAREAQTKNRAMLEHHPGNL
jgi:hypothetical protein